MQGRPPGLWRAPDVFVIGAYKSGTSSLARILEQVPGLHVIKPTEPNFFGDKLGNVTDWGRYARICREATSADISIEISPQYMTDPTALSELLVAAPGSRFLAILRNPIDRLVSDYSMYLRDGMERRSLDLVIQEFVSALDTHHSSRQASSYAFTSLYGAQLRPFFQALPSGRIRAVSFESLFRNQSDDAWDALGSFLGVPLSAPRLLVKENASGIPRSRLSKLYFATKARTPRSLKQILPTEWRRHLNDRVSADLDSPPQATSLQRRRLASALAADVQILASSGGLDFSEDWPEFIESFRRRP